MKDMDYSYTTNIIEGDKYPIHSYNIVEATYTPSYLDCDRHNPLIEALPEPITDEGIKHLYFKACNIQCSSNATRKEQLIEVQRLRDIRMPLPFLPAMETAFHNSLMLSYRQRKMYLHISPLEVTVDNAQTVQCVVGKQAMGGDTGIGLTLLGIGGCGKSEAISIMVSRYPQIIHHSIKDVGEFIQIIWLNVVTPANANLSELYIAIAEALDDALNNMEPVYGKVIRNEKSIGGKAKYIAKLIRFFNIGSIILDEIQNLDAHSNKDSSYNSLMEIINTTKVSLVIVGTEEAYYMLCRKYYLARRTGSIIDASRYCNNREQFSKKMQFIMRYNWFKDDVVQAPMNDILDQLYQETHGVIDRMVSLWTSIQIAYISAKDDAKPAITPTFIQLIANETNPLLAAYTEQTLENSPFIFEESLNFDEPIEPITNIPQSILGNRQAEADNLLFGILKKTSNPKAAERIYQNVKNALILNDTPYNDQKILEKVVSTMNRTGNADVSEDELAKRVVKNLKKQPCDSRPKPKVAKHDELKDEFIKTFTNPTQ